MVATKFISDLKMTKKGQINYWFVLVTPHNAKKNNQNTFVNQMPSCVQCVPKKKSSTDVRRPVSRAKIYTQ